MKYMLGGQEISRGAMGLFSLRSLVCAATVAVGTLACAGRSHSDKPSTEKTACAKANDYVASCGATNWTSTCYGSEDEECEATCELQTSCAYFLGQNPSEGPQIAQCGSRCTCEEALRRSEECGVTPSFDCSAICNCGYSYECDGGVAAYASCRAECPPWPGAHGSAQDAGP